jgi:hypothetical protein
MYHWNVKHQWFVRELISLSAGRTLSDAISEWDFGGCREADSPTHCQGCHTPLRWVITLVNRVTQSRLLIGNICYANFLVFLETDGIISKSLLSPQKHGTYIREHFQGIFLNFPGHTHIAGKKIIAAVTAWFSAQETLPDSVAQTLALILIKRWNTLSFGRVHEFIEHYKNTRRFTHTELGLIVPATYPDQNIPALITISQFLMLERQFAEWLANKRKQKEEKYAKEMEKIDRELERKRAAERAEQEELARQKQEQREVDVTALDISAIRHSVAEQINFWRRFMPHGINKLDDYLEPNVIKTQEAHRYCVIPRCSSWRESYGQETWNMIQRIPGLHIDPVIRERFNKRDFSCVELNARSREWLERVSERTSGDFFLLPISFGSRHIMKWPLRIIANNKHLKEDEFLLGPYEVACIILTMRNELFAHEGFATFVCIGAEWKKDENALAAKREKLDGTIFFGVGEIGQQVEHALQASALAREAKRREVLCFRKKHGTLSLERVSIGTHPNAFESFFPLTAITPPWAR